MRPRTIARRSSAPPAIPARRGFLVAAAAGLAALTRRPALADLPAQGASALPSAFDVPPDLAAAIDLALKAARTRLVALADAERLETDAAESAWEDAHVTAAATLVALASHPAETIRGQQEKADAMAWIMAGWESWSWEDEGSQIAPALLAALGGAGLPR